MDQYYPPWIMANGDNIPGSNPMPFRVNTHCKSLFGVCNQYKIQADISAIVLSLIVFPSLPWGYCLTACSTFACCAPGPGTVTTKEISLQISPTYMPILGHETEKYSHLRRNSELKTKIFSVDMN